MQGLSFFVHGQPAPAGSKRAFTVKRKDGSIGVGVDHASKRSAPWMATVAGVAANAVFDGVGPWDTSGPFLLQVVYYFQRPKSHYRTGRNEKLLKDSAPKRHTQTPDRGKLDRALEDALTGVIYADDSQVFRIESEKKWVDRFGGNQGAYVIAERIEE